MRSSVGTNLTIHAAGCDRFQDRIVELSDRVFFNTRMHEPRRAARLASPQTEQSTIEPHPTRDGVDVVTYRCPTDGDIWRSVVVDRVEAGRYEKNRDPVGTMM